MKLDGCSDRGAEELRVGGEGLRDLLEGGRDKGGDGGSLFPKGLEAEASS